MTDFQLMANLKRPFAESDVLFKDVQLRTLKDNNKTSYSSGQLNFDTSNASPEHWAFTQTDLQIPFSVNVTGALSAANCLGVVATSLSTAEGPALMDANGRAANGAAPNTGGVLTLGARGSIAPKLSTLSMINGIDISLNNGGTGIVSELKNISIINNIRLLVQHNLDWAHNHAAQFCFAKNTDVIIPNDGFNQRQKYLYNMSRCTYYNLPTVAAGASTTGYISRLECVVTIPLSMIHNFFANCDWPSRGIDWNINFHLCKEFNPNQQYYGFDVVNIPAAQLNWVPGSANVADVNYTSSSLKYKAITFQPHFGEEVAAGMLNGSLARRTVKFASAQVYDDKVNHAGDLSSYQIANGIVRPIRMWVLGYYPDTIKTQAYPTNTNLLLKSLNVQINTVNRFSQGLNTPYDLYDQVKDQMAELATSSDKGSLLNFNDFFVSNIDQFQADDNGQEINGRYALYCIDLAHVQNRLDDQAVNLILDTVKVSSQAANVDYIVVVERELTALFEYERNSCTITVGSLVA